MNHSTIEGMYAEAENRINACTSQSSAVKMIKEYKDRALANNGDVHRIRKIGQEKLEQFAIIATPDAKYKPPTPQVSQWVQWFPKGRKDHPVAALVTRRLEPGRVKLTLFPEDQQCKYILTCWHHGHPLHAVPGNQTDKHGTWDYKPGAKIPKADYDLFDSQQREIDRKSEANEKKLKNEAELAKARVALRQKKAADPKNVVAGDEFQEPGEV